MSTPIHAQLTGSFVSDGTAFNLSLPSGYDKFELFNVTSADYLDANSTKVFTAVGTALMPSGSAQFSIGAGGASLLTPGYTAVNGFTFISDSALIQNGSPVVITGISNAAQAVVSTATTTGLVDDVSVVRVYGTTGMLQIAGMDFTIDTVNPGVSFVLKYLDSQNGNGFAAAATAGNYIKINSDPRFYPRHRFITKMTSVGTSTDIQLSVDSGYTVGQAIRIIVPSSYQGMTSLNGTLATITAINAPTNTITVDVDSSGAGTFKFPNSFVNFTGDFAMVVPVGEAATTVAGVVNPANLLDDRTRNISFTGITIGTAVQTNGSTYQWIATKGVTMS